LRFVAVNGGKVACRRDRAHQSGDSEHSVYARVTVHLVDNELNTIGMTIAVPPRSKVP